MEKEMGALINAVNDIANHTREMTFYEFAITICMLVDMWQAANRETCHMTSTEIADIIFRSIKDVNNEYSEYAGRV